jgi:hypothetical protein
MKAKKSVPDSSVFKDRDKEARFWEKNFNKAWAAGKPVNAKFAKNLSMTLNIRPTVPRRPTGWSSPPPTGGPTCCRGSTP